MKKIIAFVEQLMKRKRFMVSFIAITLLCCLVAISGLNKPHLSPFSVKLATKYPTAVAYSDYGSELIDNEQHRMLILDENDRLVAVADASKSGSPVNRFNGITMYEDRIFIVGTEAYNRGSYYASEKIVEYDRNGKVVQTVYSENYAEDERVTRQRFADVSVYGNGLYLTKVQDKDVSVLRISADGRTEDLGSCTLPEAVYTASYVATENYCLALGLSKNCYVVDFATGEVTVMSFEEYIDALLKAYNVNPDEFDVSILKGTYCIPTIVLNGDGVAQYYCVVDSEGELRFVLSNDTTTQYDISTVSLSPLLFLKTLGYWLALAILGLELIAFLLFLLLTKSSPNAKKLLLFIAIAVLISVFYTNRIRQSSEESYTKSLVTQAKQISYVLSESCGDIFKEIGERGVYDYCTDLTNQADIDELRTTLKALCDQNDSTQSCYAVCYLYDPDGALYTLADSCNYYMAGEPVYIAPKLLEALGQGNSGTLTTDTIAESMIYDYECIYAGDGSVVGYIFLCGMRGNLLYVQTQTVINMTVSLLALLIGVYMAITLFKTFSADIRRRGLRDAADTEAKSLDMAGILAFVQGIVYSLDAVVLVYVAKSLCVGLPDDKVAFLVSLPITAGSLGTMAGTMLLNPVRKRLGDRGAALLCAAATLGSMLLLAFSVVSHNIYLFTAGCLLKSLFLSGMFYNILQTVPYRAKQAEDKTTTRESIQMGNMAASIISALIGGYISQYLSYTAIYILAAVLAGLLLFLCTLGFTKKGDAPATEAAKAGGMANFLKGWIFFLRGPGLIYVLFYSLPWVITGGYKSYLFPMYSSGAGFSALLLSNLSVFVTTFAFIVGPGLKNLGKKLNPTVTLLAPQFLVCACLMCFILSPNIYWAIAMMFVYQSVQNLLSGAAFSYLNGLSEESGMDQKQIFENNARIKNAYNTVRTPVLSAAVSLGMNYACTVVGAVCGAMYGIFLFFENRRKKNKARTEREK